ncbi:MAG TPA: UbiX family flavin prenyltransferase [Acidobacteriota bacterium]|nr:UbiX family flavin prenyltransferase [Acidobacteriota bacterium]
MNATNPKKLIVAITGATGSIFGVRILQVLRSLEVESHLVLSKWGAHTLTHETSFTVGQLERLASATYKERDLGAAISSGSFTTDGMIVAPCSSRTLSAIAHGHGDNLIHRAADVVLKERRKLVLVVRESPLSDIHLENMLKLSRMGAVIIPPVPAFYSHPETVKDIVDHIVMRVLDQVGIRLDLARRWDGAMSAEGTRAEKE